MRKIRLTALLALAFALPLAAVGCSEGPTQVRTVPTFRPDCGVLPPPDTTCRDGGTAGSGNRVCC